MKHNELRKMVVSALLMAVGLVLPFLVGQVQVLGQAISPLHIPALICGLTCGWSWGTALGFILPLLRGALFGFPPIVPNGLSMAFELAVYGALTGVLYPLFCKATRSHLPAVIASMLIAMVLGRIVGGAAKAMILGFQGKGYTFEAFVAAYFAGTWVGAVLHLIIVPTVVLSLERAGLSPMFPKKGH